MATLVIDGVTYEVDPANNLLQECLSQGLDLPYFCWHPCMGSVGACRQCAVKQYRDEDDTEGAVVMACMTPAIDGGIFSIEDQHIKQFRANVIESLMISHPHDCPVCEEGGECHLQDMTLMSGHNYRRYSGKKVTHNNQYLGPFVGHEMNRCITCYRCVRYYDDYAGGTDLSAQASHHHTYFGRQTDGFLESEFSGNLVEVCPTGVFTDATFSEHYARKWDLQCAPSVCVGCAVGCNTTPGERYGSLRRIVNRYNSQVNGYFLCDRGRFGYGFVNSDQRLTSSLTNDVENGEEQPKSLSIDGARDALNAALDSSSGKVIGIGSPRAGNEANFALMKRVGAENFYSGLSDTEHQLTQAIINLHRDPQLHCPNIKEIESADCVLIVGEDVTNVAPRIALAIRQSVRNRADELASDARIPLWQDAAVRELAQNELSPLYVLSGYATRLDDVATGQRVDSIEAQVQIAAAIASGISNNAPEVNALQDDDTQQLVSSIVNDLSSAKRPLIISGSSNGSLNLLHSAVNIARALADKSDAKQTIDFAALVPEVNTIGLGLLVNGDNTLGAALSAMEAGEVSTAVVLENDLYRRASKSKVDAAFRQTGSLVVVDQLRTATTDSADLIIACTSFPEQSSTFVNYEGRAQLSLQVHISESENLPAWSWLQNANETGASFESTAKDCESSVSELSGLCKVLPDRSRYENGIKVPRQSHRYSGRTAMAADNNVHEAKQAQDEQTIMAFSMEGVSHLKDASVMASSWAPQWNSNQSISKFQDEIGGELKQGNPGIRIIGKQSEPQGYYAVELASNGSASGRYSTIQAYQIFGSDEMSKHAEPVKERLIGDYAALSPADAAALQVAQNDQIALNIGDVEVEYPVCVREKVRPGTVVIYNEQGDYLDLADGRDVTLSKAQGTGEAQFVNLIVSDLFEEGY